MLSDMFGAAAVDPLIRAEKLQLTVDNKNVVINLATLVRTCIRLLCLLHVVTGATAIAAAGT